MPGALQTTCHLNDYLAAYAAFFWLVIAALLWLDNVNQVNPTTLIWTGIILPVWPPLLYLFLVWHIAEASRCAIH